jgi:N-acetylglucosamine kinase-like BadF-type ATPase
LHHYSRCERFPASGFGTSLQGCDIFGAMAFYLGIDGGGTKTKFLLGDEQRVLAEANVGGSNILRSGVESVRAFVRAGCSEVCKAAGVHASAISCTVAGIAGSSNEEVRATLLAMLRETIPGEIVIVGDMVIAHQAALDGAPGVLVNSGTGSIAYGKNAKNEAARAGGWGFAISDEGSGHWIGRAAIAIAMRRYDSRQDDGFLQHLKTAIGADEIEDLARFANSTANPDFAKAFPAVLALAERGDATAREILKRAGAELAELGLTVTTRLFDQSESVSVAAGGGVFRSSSMVFESFSKTLAAERPGLQVSLSEADPAVGALQLARISRG